MFLPITQQILQHWHFPGTGSIRLQDSEINGKEFSQASMKDLLP